MRYERILTTMEEIKVFSDPFRLKILMTFDGNHTPQTVKQIADKLGEVPAKVHYHIKELERIDVLEIVDKREKSGILEKYYLPTAENIRIDKSVRTWSTNLEDADRLRSNMVSEIHEEFTKHLTDPLRKSEDIVGIKFGTTYLTEDETKEFEKLYLDFLKGKTKREGTIPYRHALIVFRKYDE